MKKSNRGFTLIELIVVLTILGIAAGLVGLTVGTAVFAKTKGTATSVNMLISECRTGCLTKASDKGPTYLTLSLEGRNLVGRYYENGSLISTDTFSSAGMTVSYKKTDSAEPVVLVYGGAALTLSFDRSTGGLKQSDGAYCQSIYFDAGRVYTIEFVPITGMHRLV